MEWPCGDAPGGTISAGSPTPSITRATSECTGAISVATCGAAMPGPAHPSASPKETRNRVGMQSSVCYLITYLPGLIIVMM